MSRSRPFFAITLVFIAVLAGWIWWVKPRHVDMAAYAPADSLLFLEANRPLDVVNAIASTDAWKIVDNLTGSQKGAAGGGWLQGLVRVTGIGPIETVVLTRAQLAVVVTDLGATEDTETLRIKPEGALIIETQTAERRIRPSAENAIKKLAEAAYGQPVLRKTIVDGAEFMAWSAPDGARQIVATIAGSLVIIGNTQRSVEICLAVSQGRRPSLRGDAELNRLRLQLGAANALSFGYVPPANSPRLLSIVVPLLLGRAPANSEFQRFITTGAAKVFGSLGWSSHPFMTGIEDRFLISLQPSMLARLKPNFGSIKLSGQAQQILPSDADSVTYYKFENPLAAWRGIKSGVSSQIDALSAIVFSSLLNSALEPYGIGDPEAFLASTSAEMFTLRINQNSERSIVVARVRDQAKLRELLSKTLQARSTSNPEGQIDLMVDQQGESAAGFVGEFVVIGSPADVRTYTEAVRTNTALANPDRLSKMTFFAPLSGPAVIVTYANDSDRVRSFVSAVRAAKAATPVPDNLMDQMLYGLPYSATETSLGEHGFERTTRSPLGQFSTLLPLLIPERRSP